MYHEHDENFYGVPKKTRHSLVTISRDEYKKLLLTDRLYGRGLKSRREHYRSLSLWGVLKEYWQAKHRKD